MEQSTNLIPKRLTKPKQIINYIEAKPNTAENNPNLSANNEHRELMFQ